MSGSGFPARFFSSLATAASHFLISAHKAGACAFDLHLKQNRCPQAQVTAVWTDGEFSYTLAATDVWNRLTSLPPRKADGTTTPWFWTPSNTIIVVNKGQRLLLLVDG